MRSTHITHRSRLAAAVVAALALAWLPAFGGAPPVAGAAACLRFDAARFDAPGDDALNINGEFVRLRNGCAGTVTLGGWRVRDRAGITFRFPSTARLGGGKVAYLHSGSGATTSLRYYWGRTQPVWGNDSTERAYLVRSDGRVLSTWPSSAPSPAAGLVSFGSRPPSGPISRSDCADVTIRNVTIRDTPAGVPAIRLVRCHNVTIDAVDLINVAGGIVAIESSNIRVINTRYANITGPAQPRTGANVANFVQFDRVDGGLIARNAGKGGDTEDVVSIHGSSNIVVEDNHFEGTNWTSRSSSGIALSDAGGSNNVARRNRLLNVGAVGIFIAGGTNSRIEDNVIVGEARPGSNVGMYVWNLSSGPCSGHAVTRNRVLFRKPDGSLAGWWSGGNCGAVQLSGNDLRAQLSVSVLRVHL